MTRVSKRKVNPDALKKIFDLFFEVAGKRKNKEEFNRIISELLSPTEQIMVAKRVAILYLLQKNIDCRTISRVLKVSSTTISKFSLLSQYSTAIVPALNKALAVDSLTLLMEETFSMMLGPGTYGVDWKAAWERKHRISRKKDEGL